MHRTERFRALRPAPPRLRTGWRILALLAAFALSVPVAADRLHLANGDRITGRVVRMVEGTLVITTDWGGEISVPWARVERLLSDEALDVRLDDERRLDGPAVEAPSGNLAIAPAPGEAPVVVLLERVAAVNPPVSPKLRLDGRLGLGLLTSRGNTDTESVIVEGELVARTAASRYTVGATVNEAEEEGEKTVSHATAHLAYDRFFGPRWYLASNLRLTEDEFRDLSLRTAAGLGGGYQLWEGPPSSLAFELGLSLVEEDFIGLPDERFLAGRWSVDLEVPVGSSQVRFFHRQEGLLDLDAGGDVVVVAQTGFRFTLLERLVASTRLEIDHDSAPAPGRRETDTTFWANLGYEW